MKTMNTLAMSAAAIVVWTLSGQTARSQTFVGLGVDPVVSATAPPSISDDGTTVCGNRSGALPWSWLASGGIQTLNLSGGIVTDISSEGRVIVGARSDLGVFRYENGVQTFLTGMADFFGTTRVSGDGRVVTGNSDSSGARALYWTAAAGVQEFPIGNPIPPYFPGFAETAAAVNFNGTVIAGSMYVGRPGFPFALGHAFRWTPASGSDVLLTNGPAPEPLVGGVADCSADGSVLVCASGSSVQLWTQAGGFAPIFSRGPYNIHISADASAVVAGDTIWSASTGARSVVAALTAAGCNFQGWTDLRATGVSGNGLALCGYGTNPLGQSEAWYATIPTPGAATVLAVGALATGARRRRAISFSFCVARPCS